MPLAVRPAPVRAESGFSLVETLVALALLAATLLAAAAAAVSARAALARAAAAGRGQQTLAGAVAALGDLPADHAAWSGEPLPLPDPGGAVLEAVAAPWPGRPGLTSVDLALRMRAGAGRDEVVRLRACVRRRLGP